MGKWRNGDGKLTVAGRDEHAIPVQVAASYPGPHTRAAGPGRDRRLANAHSVRQRAHRPDCFSIDVAYLDKKFNVIAVRTMKPGRLGLPRLRSRHVLESKAGAMEEWGVRPSAQVHVEV